MTTQQANVHEKAIVEEGVFVGKFSNIWAFTHLLCGSVVGEHCNICDHVFIESKVVIGNRVTVKSGVQLWDGTTLEDDVFVGPNVTFTNDKYPRSKIYPDSYPSTLVKVGASLGAGSIILPGITIGRYAMVGAGAVVTKDVPDNALVIGNPARIVRYLT